MRTYEIIYKKRQGESLSEEEVKYLINGYISGDIPDYQMSAWAMAVYFQGMNEKEVSFLTKAMAESGDIVDLGSISGTKVDKHSTGGVGDTTTLVLIPMVAAAGVPVAKMSGRGLGHTGGTIDKLESIPGFSTELTIREFIDGVNKIGAAIAGHTGNLTPADKMLYSLRDVTATIDSIPLIASSIMSKKIAGGTDGIVLDVKTGSGAFMKNIKDARKLATTMVDIGKRVKKKTIALITDMEQPLGKAVGNSLEVIEAVQTLSAEGPEDLEELCLALGANMLILAGQVEEYKEGYNQLKMIINSGRGLNKFAELIEAQGGDPDIIGNFDILPGAKQQIKIYSNYKGYVNRINAMAVGNAAMLAGAGREKKGDKIDKAAGVKLHKKCGDMVNKGDLLAIIHSNKERIALKTATKILQDSFQISSNIPQKSKLIHDIIK